jgi:PEP-CTERM motif
LSEEVAPSGVDKKMDESRYCATWLGAAAQMLAVGAVAIALAQPARADLVFSGTGTNNAGHAISATVDFSLTGTDFRMVITNNDQSYEPAGVLTNLGVLTAPAPATALPSASGTIAPSSGSNLVYSGTPTTGTLGQGWAYVAGASGGTASSGWGVGLTAGNVGNLCGSSSCPRLRNGLDGSAFGVVGPGTDVSNSNLKKKTYVNNSVTIDITLASNSTFTLADITSVDFQYGTNSGEGAITVDGCTGGSDCSPTIGGGGGATVPEPASAALLGFGLIGLALVRARPGRQRASSL